MASVFLSETVTPNAPQKSTMTAIISPNPRSGRDMMQASLAYSILHTTGRKHFSAISGPTGGSFRWTRFARVSVSSLNHRRATSTTAVKKILNSNEPARILDGVPVLSTSIIAPHTSSHSVVEMTNYSYNLR